MKRIFVVALLLAVIAVCVQAEERNTVQIMVLDSSGNFKFVGEAAGAMGIPFSAAARSGILGTATLSIPLASAVSLPAAPTGAKNLLIMPTQDVNWSAVGVPSGAGQQYFFADIPSQGLFGFSDFAGFRFIGRTAVATATLIWLP
jgi:hypothetical protein